MCGKFAADSKAEGNTVYKFLSTRGNIELGKEI
jgi:hypothetical protein